MMMSDFEPIKAIWEVTAGVMPNFPIDDYYKRWHLLSREWDGGSEKGRERYEDLVAKVAHYAQSIQNPSGVNWVRMEWTWL